MSHVSDLAFKRKASSPQTPLLDTPAIAAISSKSLQLLQQLRGPYRHKQLLISIARAPAGPRQAAPSSSMAGAKQLSFSEAHKPGLCDVAYLPAAGGAATLITAGADGRVCYRSAEAPAEAAKEIENSNNGASAPVHCVAAAQGRAVVTGDDQNFVKVRRQSGLGRGSVRLHARRPIEWRGGGGGQAHTTGHALCPQPPLPPSHLPWAPRPSLPPLPSRSATPTPPASCKGWPPASRCRCARWPSRPRA